MKKKIPFSETTATDFLPDADEIERRPLPWLARITLKLLLTALVVFLLWANFSNLDLVVTARGRLVTPLPNIIVQPFDTAIIQNIDVRVGQVVKKGDRLATLDATFVGADEAELRTRLKSLETQVKRLTVELSGSGDLRPLVLPKGSDGQLQASLSKERTANFVAQKRRMQETVSRLRASIETNQRDQQALQARLLVLRDLEGMQQSLLAKNAGARTRLLESQERRLEAERDLELSRNREREIKKELSAFEAEKVAFESSWRQKTMEDLLAVSRDRDGVKEQLQKADKRNKLVTLVSPADAVVLDIAKLSLGSVIRGAEPFFTLVPLDAELEAEVQVSAPDVGYVKAGDQVRVKFDAFPFQKHGALAGELRTLSEDAFRRESAAGGEAYYLGRVRLGEGKLREMSSRSRLVPGMTVSAEIVVGTRSVISYLLWPLTKTFSESLHEP